MNAQLMTGMFTLAAAAVGFWGIRYTQAQQARQQELQRLRDREKEYLADARTLRDAKRERLRESYAIVIDAVWLMNTMTAIAVESLSGLGNGDADQRWDEKRHQIEPVLATA